MEKAGFKAVEFLFPYAYPVEEITIAGNLKDMYKNIVAIGNDLVFRGASAAPTIRVEGMMIAGA